MKKQLLMGLVALCLPLTMAAQNTAGDNARQHDVYLELLGGSTLVGVSYDSRFNNHTRWGWRAGLSFAYSNRNGVFSNSNDMRYWAVPVGINYLVGSHRNSLEIGFGASVGVVNIHQTITNARRENITQEEADRYNSDYSLIPDNASMGYDEATHQNYLTYYSYRNDKKNCFGYFFFGEIGYRHVARSGFLFRVGLNPAFNFGDDHAISPHFSDTFHKFSLGGYVGLGWVF